MTSHRQEWQRNLLGSIAVYTLPSIRSVTATGRELAATEQELWTEDKRGLCLGLLSGLFLTFPLLALLYLGYRLAYLPFPPFNLFDWQTRILPGSVLARGIETMVHIIGWFHVTSTSRVAKLAEQSMAVSEFILAGMVFSALFFTFLRLRTRKASLLAGGILGIALGVATAWATNSVEASSTISPAARAVWIVAMFLFWGASLAWVYQRMIHHEVAAATGAVATASVVERADRRWFLARFAGVAAVITVVTAAVGKLGGRREAAASGGEGEPWSATHPLPNAGATVQPAAGTRPELTPVSQHYRIDINTSPPSIREAVWRLNIHGLVAKPLEWTLADLRARPALHQFITLSCISNPVGGDLIGTTRWSGVSLQGIVAKT
jgi:Oxidoreductase molybdopterin binding domain